MGNVRVIQGRKRLRFAREAREPLRIACEYVWQDPERDGAIELGVARQIDQRRVPAATC